MKTDTICRELPCDDAHERPRFFPRQLITPDDLNLVLEHFGNKLRRHNRLLHGWGVVCGAKVCPITKMGGGMEAWKVKVTQGYILGPYGDEILIDCERTVDLRTSGVTGVTGEPCIEVPDPWCSEVFVQSDQTGPRYVAVKYKEIMTRPVRVQPIGCGCDDTQCEYSRLRDGYEIGVLSECPKSHMNQPTPMLNLSKGPLPKCPACPPDPWVVLAEVEVNDDGMINKIDNCSCRRLVISFGHFWWQCEVKTPTISSITIDRETFNNKSDSQPIEVKRGQDVEMTINGTNFTTGLRVDLGPGIKVMPTSPPSETEVKVELNVNGEAPITNRTVTLTNPDCAMAEFPNAIHVGD